MCSRVMLALAISKIFLARVPFNIIYILGNFVAHPEIMHFHGLQTLTFHRIICNADSGCVVAVYLHFGLQVAKFLKGELKNHAFFAI